MGRGGDSINIYNLDCLVGMKDLDDESIDLITTDPPYGISFMGKNWDKALPDKRIWVECLRVLRAGSFAFVMSIPRSDCLSRMIISLEDAGFLVNFTPIFWAYASGFPKAQNIGKAVDKRLGAKRVVIGENIHSANRVGEYEGWGTGDEGRRYDTKSTSPQAKALDGSYGGFQPKPAVEVIIVAMKPLSEKTFVDQALKNGKGITWLDDCRIPYESEPKNKMRRNKNTESILKKGFEGKPKEIHLDMAGRFPANLLVSDDVLNDGKVRKGGGVGGRAKHGRGEGYGFKPMGENIPNIPTDSGSFSRYFDLDKWWTGVVKELPESARKTFPFLIVPKASKSEKNRGLNFEPIPMKGRDEGQDIRNVPYKARSTPRINPHPTVKPIKLFSYLVTLGSRAGDVVLDPFGGTMTTAVACAVLGRKFIGYEIDASSYEISQGRVKAGWQIKLDALGGKG